MENYYEDITIKRDSNYANISKALDIVKEFVISKNLILYGGMAIDASLKIKGHAGIYHETKQPDYDFLSSDPILHSKQIGKLICNAELPNVSIINGIHVTTRRVRVNFISVADISFCPKTILDKIPTITKDGLIYTHPNFQIMDIHRSLSFAFESPTRPTIFHRWARDMKRYDMLYPLYPIKASNVTVKTYTPKLDKNILKDHCIGGWAALSYWVTGDINKLKIPVGEPITILSDSFTEFTRNKPSAIYRNSLFGKIPRNVDVTIDNYTYNIIDNEGDRVAAECIGDKIYVTNLQHVMLFLLAKKFMDDNMSDANRLYCNDAYIKCIELVSSKFHPTINYYGYASWSDSYIINRRKESAKISGTSVRNADDPMCAFPKFPECINNITFDYSASEFFGMDGSITSQFMQKTLVNFGQNDVISDSYDKIKRSRYLTYLKS